MARDQGYAVWYGHGLGGSGSMDVEKKTITCCHCNDVFFVEAKQDASELGGFCRMCMAPTCASCAAKGGCDPFEKKLEAQERAGRLCAAAGV